MAIDTVSDSSNCENHQSSSPSPESRLLETTNPFERTSEDENDDDFDNNDEAEPFQRVTINALNSSNSASPAFDPRASKRYDYLYKLIVVGDTLSGKTSLINRYIEDSFDENFITTIGIDFKMKIVRLREKLIKLQIWDTAGQERYAAVGEMFYKGASGVVVCYDISSKRSFLALERWIEKVRAQTEQDKLLITIVGCKSDLESEREVTKDEGHEFAIRYSARFLETSSKTGTSDNIQKAFEDLTSSILSSQLGEYDLENRASAVRNRDSAGGNDVIDGGGTGSAFVRATRNSMRSVRKSIRKRASQINDMRQSFQKRNTAGSSSDKNDSEGQQNRNQTGNTFKSCCNIS